MEATRDAMEAKRDAMEAKRDAMEAALDSNPCPAGFNANTFRRFQEMSAQERATLIADIRSHQDDIRSHQDDIRSQQKRIDSHQDDIRAQQKRIDSQKELIDRLSVNDPRAVKRDRVMPMGVPSTTLNYAPILDEQVELWNAAELLPPQESHVAPKNEGREAFYASLFDQLHRNCTDRFLFPACKQNSYSFVYSTVSGAGKTRTMHSLQKNMRPLASRRGWDLFCVYLGFNAGMWLTEKELGFVSCEWSAMQVILRRLCAGVTFQLRQEDEGLAATNTDWEKIPFVNDNVPFGGVISDAEVYTKYLVDVITRYRVERGGPDASTHVMKPVIIFACVDEVQLLDSGPQVCRIGLGRMFLRVLRFLQVSPALQKSRILVVPLGTGVGADFCEVPTTGCHVEVTSDLHVTWETLRGLLVSYAGQNNPPPEVTALARGNASAIAMICRPRVRWAFSVLDSMLNNHVTAKRTPTLRSATVLPTFSLTQAQADLILESSLRHIAVEVDVNDQNIFNVPHARLIDHFYAFAPDFLTLAVLGRLPLYETFFSPLLRIVSSDMDALIDLVQRFHRDDALEERAFAAMSCHLLTVVRLGNKLNYTTCLLKNAASRIPSGTELNVVGPISEPEKEFPFVGPKTNEVRGLEKRVTDAIKAGKSVALRGGQGFGADYCYFFPTGRNGVLMILGDSKNGQRPQDARVQLLTTACLLQQALLLEGLEVADIHYFVVAPNAGCEVEMRTDFQLATANRESLRVGFANRYKEAHGAAPLSSAAKNDFELFVERHLQRESLCVRCVEYVTRNTFNVLPWKLLLFDEEPSAA
jgi:hypothetical protein